MQSVKKHKQYINDAIQNNTFEHQQTAANKAFSKFKNGSRAVVIAAEMQSGKSGIALTLACLQRLSLSDEAMCDRKYLKDTLYLVTMADTALQEQAKQDLDVCKNLVVSNFSNFQSALKTHFKHQPPKLIIIDECHYGSSVDSVRYERIFNYLDNENKECKVALVSATPFSALYAAGADSILHHNFKASLVFHKTNNEYHGIREMHNANQIIKLDETFRNFCDSSLLQKRFIKQYKEYQGTGWSLIRVPSSQARLAKEVLMQNDISDDQIHIIGQKLVDVDDNELCSIDDFKREYETAKLFDEKLIAITVAGFRAGVNFGQEMKETLINSWDSTIANIAAIVQANIGRACGYHTNTQAKHYTNLEAVSAYSELLRHLESRDDSNEFEGLRDVFEQVCTKYSIRGFDRGTTVTNEPEYTVTKKLDDSQTYMTDCFIAIPGKLDDPDFDFSTYTNNLDLLKAISLIRQELLSDDGPYRKTKRALRGEHQNWIKAQWVNGATYDNGTQSSAKSRAITFTTQLSNNENVEFNQIVNPGGGEKTEDKTVMASIFSIYNISTQKDAFKRTMDQDDMEEICQTFNIETDDTLILLYLRGEHSQEESTKKEQQLSSIRSSHIREKSIF